MGYALSLFNWGQLKGVKLEYYEKDFNYYIVNNDVYRSQWMYES